MGRKSKAQIEFSIKTQGFDEGVKKMNAEIKSLSNELRLNAEQMKGASDKTELLQERQGLLQQELSASRQKVTLIGNSLKEAEQMLGKNSKEYYNLTQALTRAKTEQEKIKNELQQVNTQIGKNTEENQELKNSYQFLEEEIRGQKEKMSALKDAYANVVLETSKESQEAVQLKQDIENLSASIKQNEESLKGARDAANALTQENQEAKNGYQRLTEETEKQRTKLQSLKTEYANVVLETSKNSREAKELKKEIETLSTQLSKSETELRKADNAADELTEGFEKAEKGALDFSDVLGANLASGAILQGISALKDVIVDIGESTIGLGIDTQKGMNSFAAETGIAGEELQKMEGYAKELYKGNFGSSVQEIAGNMADVNHITGETGEALKETTKNAMTLSDTFGMDINENVRGANGLMYQFGLDASGAFDLLAKGAQEGLNYTGELGDNVAEYGGKFAQAGYSASDYFQLLKNGTSNGAYNLDKVNDAINEVTNRLADGTIADSMSQIDEKTGKVKEGTAGWSQKTEDVFHAWQNGQATQKDVIDSIVADINSCTNEQEALTMAATAFGTMGEDSNLKFIGSLSSVGETFSDVGGTMEEINNIKYNDLESSISGIKRSIEVDVLGPVQDRLLPALSDLANNTDFEALGEKAAGALDGVMDAIEFVVENQNVFLPLAAGIAGFGTAAQVASVGVGIYNGVMDIMALSSGAATAATTGLGVAFQFLTSPIGAVSLAIGAAVGVGIALYKNWDTIKEKAGELKEWISEKWEGMKTAVAEKAEGIRTAAAEKFNQVKEAMGTAMQAAKDTVNEKLSNIKQAYNEHGGGIKGIAAGFMEGVKGYYTLGYTFIDNLTGGKLSSIAGKFKSKMDEAKTAVHEKMDAIKEGFKSKIEGAKDAVSNGINKIKSFFNFSWSLPKLKLPHFSVSGKFSLNPPSIPHFSVDWYAKGALFTGPTIIPANGFGEAGHEYALPLNRISLAPLANMLGDMILDKLNDINRFDRKGLEKIIDKYNRKEYIFQVGRRQLIRIIEDR